MPAPAAPSTRIVFMGTSDFAVPVLAALVAAGPVLHTQVVAAYTQPDRPAGRGKKLAFSPVKNHAVAAGISVVQPAGLRKQPAALDALAAFTPDLIVVAAYGLILPPPVLAIPRFGCINVHASLLPAYRGASPIVAAILDGLAATGVSIMLMDEGMDTGPVLAQIHQPIRADDTTATLSARLAHQGAALLVATLPGWLAGALAPLPQAKLPGTPSLCRLIRKEQGAIDWRQPATTIERMTRAYTPWPGAYTAWAGGLLRIWRAAVLAGEVEPGRVVRTQSGPAVGTGEGLLQLTSVQAAGKRVMDAASFVNGAPDFIGALLG